MIIIEALRSARTEYVVYFLLSAWLEILDHSGRTRGIAADIKSLPVRDAYDVYRRLRLVREALATQGEANSTAARALRDTAAAFSMACDKVRELRESRVRMPVFRVVRMDGPSLEGSVGGAASTASLEYALEREREAHACLREAPFD